MSDFYGILGVEKSATLSEIRQAYRASALQFHPDKNPDNREFAETQFKKIEEAFRILSDPSRRKIYDETGTAGLAQEQTASQMMSRAKSVFFDMFAEELEQLKSGNNKRCERPASLSSASDFKRPRSTEPEAFLFDSSVRRVLELTLMEFHKGASKRFRMSVQSPMGPRSQPQEKVITVVFPPGLRPGMVLCFNDDGEMLLPGSKKPQALVLILKLKPHPEFAIENDDLVKVIKLPLWDALLGTDISVTDLEGVLHNVPMNGAVLSHNSVITIPGQGLSKEDGGRGDLRVRCEISFPDKVPPELQSVLQKLKSAS